VRRPRPSKEYPKKGGNAQDLAELRGIGGKKETSREGIIKKDNHERGDEENARLSKSIEGGDRVLGKKPPGITAWDASLNCARSSEKKRGVPIASGRGGREYRKRLGAVHCWGTADGV